ncbi:MAG: cytochrome c4, partial [Proteobacteria bacterium]
MRMKIILIAAAFALTNLSVGVAADADATAKAKAVCAGCHGPNGISTNPMWPNLAGQKDQYLVKAMKEYRDGARP